MEDISLRKYEAIGESDLISNESGYMGKMHYAKSLDEKPIARQQCMVIIF